MDDAKDVELLTLVLVDSLDLNIEQSRGVHSDADSRLDELGKSDFVGILDLGPFLTEFLVLSILLKLVQIGEVLEEAITPDLGSDELRETRVGLVEPAARSDSVGHIGELVGTVDLDKVLEDSGLDEIRVQLSNTIDLMRPNNCQERHAHHLCLRLLNDRNSAQDVSVIRESLLDLLEEKQVNVVDNLQMSGQKVLDQTNGPLLQGFGQDGVVGVTELKNVR